MMTMFEGPFEWARQKWHELQQQLVSESPKKKTVDKKEKPKKETSAEEEIIALELKIEELEKKLSDEADLSSSESNEEILISLRTKLDQFYEQWMKENES